MEYMVGGRGLCGSADRRRGARLQAVAIATCVLLLSLSLVMLLRAPAARAADETMPIAKVQPGMVGYAKTVTTGTVVTTFTVEVLSVLEGEGLTSGNLILFRASGPVIAQTGGVVPGMSGSPIYLTDPDDGHEKVAGAISYGYDWAEPKLALATPIDEMLGVLQFSGMSTILPKKYAPAGGKPISLGGGRILRSLTVDGGTDGDAVSCRPLGSVMSVSGLDVNSRLYKKLEKAMSRKGFMLTSVGGGHARADVSTATLEPGASLAVGLMTGNTTMAGVGTVTYADGNRIVGFGHPMLWTGPAELYMMTGFVHTVFPAENGGIGFKLASAGDTTGTILQDRAKAVAGKTAQFPDETSMTVRAVNTDDSTSAVKSYHIAAGAMDSLDWYWYLTSVGLLDANDSVFDGIRGGTADTTFTIRGRDCEGTPFDVSFGNKITDDYDITYSALNDVTSALDELMLNAYEPVTIDNISYEATMTSALQKARIADVSFLGKQPVKGKTMTVRVYVVPWGGRTRQAIDTTITVPKKFYVPYSDLSVSSVDYEYFYDFDEWDMGPPDVPESDPDWTVQKWAADFESRQRNDQITIRFEDWDGRYVSKTISTGLVQWGAVSKSPSNITMRRAPATVLYGGGVRFSGRVGPYVRNPRVDLWARRYGSTESTVAKTTTGTAAGVYAVSCVPTQTGTYHTHFRGTSSWLDASSTAVRVYVRARVTLLNSRARARRGQTVKLSGAVRPAHAGNCVIQRLVGRWWVRFRTMPLDASGNYSWNWTPTRRGRYVLRTRWAGDGSHLSNTSGVRIVTVL